jgi:hypothetical protein
VKQRGTNIQIRTTNANPIQRQPTLKPATEPPKPKPQDTEKAQKVKELLARKKYLQERIRLTEKDVVGRTQKLETIEDVISIFYTQKIFFYRKSSIGMNRL